MILKKCRKYLLTLATLISASSQLSAATWMGYSPPVAYTDPMTPILSSFEVAVADFNGNGILDFAVADTNDRIAVFFGNGNGTFTFNANYPTGIATGPNGIAAGEIRTGSGQIDIVTANTNGNSISYFQNNGNGTFMAAVNTPVGPGTGPGQIILGDFTGDGNLDAATANQGNSTMTVFQGNGLGGFSLFNTYSTTGMGGFALATGKFTASGRNDIAVTNFLSNDVSVFINTGTLIPPSALFAAPLLLSVIPATQPAGIQAADVSGDGNIDIIVANQSSSVTIFKGNGNGTFQAPQNIMVIGGAHRIAIADVNNDGIQDILVSNTTAVTVLLGSGGGMFLPALSFPVNQTFAEGIGVGDFNGDGFVDLVVAGTNSDHVSVLLADIMCTVNSDCPPCNNCVAGTCMFSMAAACGPCFSGGMCDDSGICVNGTPVMCNTPGPCQVSPGTCARSTGCTYPSGPDGAMCSTGNLCINGQTCTAGSCTGGTAVMCSPLDQCHVAGTCNPQTGVCTNPNIANGTSCTLLGCNSASCQSGTCTCASVGPLPPASFSGAAIQNEFLTQIDRINKLFWTASPDPTVVGYHIYRGTTLIATVPASGPFIYLDHNQRKNVTVIYTIRSFKSNGVESSPLSVSLQ